MAHQSCTQGTAVHFNNWVPALQAALCDTSTATQTAVTSRAKTLCTTRAAPSDLSPPGTAAALSSGGASRAASLVTTMRRAAAAAHAGCWLSSATPAGQRGKRLFHASCVQFRVIHWCCEQLYAMRPSTTWPLVFVTLDVNVLLARVQLTMQGTAEHPVRAVRRAGGCGSCRTADRQPAAAACAVPTRVSPDGSPIPGASPSGTESAITAVNGTPAGVSACCMLFRHTDMMTQHAGKGAVKALSCRVGRRHCNAS